MPKCDFNKVTSFTSLVSRNVPNGEKLNDA